MNDSQKVALFLSDTVSRWVADDAARMAEISTKELTNLRQREHLMFEPEEDTSAKKRFLYSNLNVLWLAHLTEVAWAIGPQKGKHVVNQLWKRIFDDEFNLRIPQADLEKLQVFLYRPVEAEEDETACFRDDPRTWPPEKNLPGLHELAGYQMEASLDGKGPRHSALVANIGWATVECAKAAVDQVANEMAFFNTLVKESALPKRQKTIQEAFYMRRGISDALKAAAEA